VICAKSSGEIVRFSRIEVQKSKVKNQNDNSKYKTFNLCSVILHFYFYILKGFGGVRAYWAEPGKSGNYQRR